MNKSCLASGLSDVTVQQKHAPLRSFPSMTEPNPTPAVVVVGSLNVDTLLNVPWLPEIGATVAASGLERRYGG